MDQLNLDPTGEWKELPDDWTVECGRGYVFAEERSQFPELVEALGDQIDESALPTHEVRNYELHPAFRDREPPTIPIAEIMPPSRVEEMEELGVTTVREFLTETEGEDEAWLIETGFREYREHARRTLENTHFCRNDAEFYRETADYPVVMVCEVHRDDVEQFSG